MPMPTPATTAPTYPPPTANTFAPAPQSTEGNLADEVAETEYKSSAASAGIGTTGVALIIVFSCMFVVAAVAHVVRTRVQSVDRETDDEEEFEVVTMGAETHTPPNGMTDGRYPEEHPPRMGEDPLVNLVASKWAPERAPSTSSSLVRISHSSSIANGNSF